jgi:mono/diheme cytochrome c family protein
MTRTLTVLLALSAAAAYGAVPAADSVRGAQLFQSQHCVECHALNGVGPKVGPDLGRIVDRGFTPDMLAGTMWNHAPAMWNAMLQRNIQVERMDVQAAADLYAFFYATRFFEEPGDAARGKRLFTELSCGNCHGITESKVAAAKPVSQWVLAGDPIAMMETMWDHAANMRDEMARQKVKWPKLTGQDISDVLVYARGLPPASKSMGVFQTTSDANAPALFMEKGCTVCHNSPEQFLSKNLRGQTLTDLAADMWNHGPIMKSAAVQFAPGEMRTIVSYVWSQRYLENKGNLERGKKIFAAKKCGVCHNDPASGAPALTSRDKDYSGITMLSVLWEHGPTMLSRMKEKQVQWPRFETREMSDLIAYLNVRDSRDAR